MCFIYPKILECTYIREKHSLCKKALFGSTQMSSINPLFKSYTLPDGNVVTMLGGGAKVSKPMFTSYQNRGPKIHVAKKPGAVSYEDHGKMTVAYSTDFDDVFGTRLSSASVIVVDDTLLNTEAEGTDMFSFDTSQTSLEFRVMNVRLDNGESQSYDLENNEVVGSLLGSSTLIESVERVDDTRSFSLDRAGVFGDREGGVVTYSIENNANDPTSQNNRSTQFRDFGNFYQVNFRFSNIAFSDFVQRDPDTGEVARDALNNPVSANIYGPFTYDVLFFAKDRNNNGNNQTHTTAVMRRQVDVQGLEDVRLEILPTPQSFANSSDSFQITWRFDDESASVSDFDNVRLCKHNLEQTEIDHLSYSTIVKTGTTTYSVDVSNVSAIETIGYQGEIKAYVQWKHVEWSPLNYSSPLTFAYSNEPDHDFRLFVSNNKNIVSSVLGEDELYLKLLTNINYDDYFPTNLPYDVTFRLHQQDSSRDEASVSATMLFSGITNTNVTTFTHQIASGLIPGTEYFISYTVDDGRNPKYTGTIDNPDTSNGAFLTRLDDRIAPVIDSFVTVPLQSEVRVEAVVSDETALSGIDVIALVGDRTALTVNELNVRINEANYKHTIPEGSLSSPNAHTVDVTLSNNEYNEIIREDNTYTIVVRATDRANNTTFAKRLVITNPTISITDVTFGTGYLQWNLQANLQFDDIPGERIDYYMGVFTSNIDSSNEQLAKNALQNPVHASNVALGFNIDASSVLSVNATLVAAFGNLEDDPLTMSAIANFNNYNLVVYAQANTDDYAFVQELYQTGLQYMADASPPVIHNMFVNFNVGL